MHTVLRSTSLALCLGLAACASYPQRTAEAYSAFERGDLDDAARRYADPSTTGSDFLGGAEAGTVAMAAGDWPGALEHFEGAHESVREIEDRMLLSPESAGELLLTWTLSESMSTYRGEGFERVMLHACMGLAYLALGQPDDAGVEARRANKLLEGEEALYEKEYAAGGLGHYLSAIVYELRGELDQAYIDYQRMLEKGVGTELAGRGALRIAKKLGYDDEQVDLEQRFGEDAARPDGAASIVVVAGVGEGPYKQEFTLPIPTGSGILQWSVPTLQARPQSTQVLELDVDEAEPRVRTDVVENVFAVTKENLDDRIAWLAAKSAVRAVLKRELTQKLEKEYDAIGALAGTLITLATEHADLRAWQTLPNTWQAARVYIAPGEHLLRLTAVGGESRVLGHFELERGETVFVFARALGPRLYAHVVGGKRLDAPAAPASPEAMSTAGAESPRPNP